MNPVPQDTIDLIAKKGTYVLNINPRQLLLNNIGIDGFEGGGNLWVGQSASNLDDVLVHLDGYYPRATIALDTGSYFEHWTPMSVEDVRRLRNAFFALYGPGKPNWYPPPLLPPTG